MAAGNFCVTGLDLTVSVNRELRIRGNGIAVRSDGFTQDVLNAGLQAVNLMGFRGGGPLFDDDVFLCLIQVVSVSRFIFSSLPRQLDVRAGQFRSAGDLGLADCDMCLVIFNNQDFNTIGVLAHRAVTPVFNPST